MCVGGEVGDGEAEEGATEGEAATEEGAQPDSEADQQDTQTKGQSPTPHTLIPKVKSSIIIILHLYYYFELVMF